MLSYFSFYQPNDNHTSPTYKYRDEMKLGFIHAAIVLSLRVWMGRPGMGSPETAGTPCNKKTLYSFDNMYTFSLEVFNFSVWGLIGVNLNWNAQKTFP